MVRLGRPPSDPAPRVVTCTAPWLRGGTGIKNGGEEKEDDSFFRRPRPRPVAAAPAGTGSDMRRDSRTRWCGGSW